MYITSELTDTLMALIKTKREIRKAKNEVVLKQDYASAAKIRVEETKIEDLIIEEVKQQGKFDFSQSKQMRDDIIKIVNLVEKYDTDFTNAISKLSKSDFNRMVLIKDIEKFRNGEFTLEELHESVKNITKNISENGE